MKVSTITDGVVVPARWIALELRREDGLEVERELVVELHAGEPRVRKLSPREKRALQEQTGEEAFFASTEEFDEYLALAGSADESSAT